MPVLPPISVTQSTAPSANTGTVADASAWADALASTPPPPQNNAPGATNAPATPKQTGGKKKEADQTQTATTDGAGGLVADQSKTTKTVKPQDVYVPPHYSKDAKKDVHLAVAVVAPMMQAQPVAEKPTATGNAKTPDEAVQENKRPTTEAKANATGTTASQAQSGSSIITSKAEPAIMVLPKGSDAAPAQTATKPQVAAAPGGPAAHTQAGAHIISATTQSAVKAGNIKGAAQAPANQPIAPSTAQALSARAAQLSENTPALPKEKEKLSTPQVTALGGANANVAEFSIPSTNNAIMHANTGVENPSTAPAALAATVTALHQSGQAGTVLRLDPPGLGHLSVEVRLGTQGQVNVLFVPSSADAAQALHASLPALGAAMAQSGLTLGQAQVGGQFSQQSGQNDQGRYTPPRQNHSTNFATEPQATPSGLSAYA